MKRLATILAVALVMAMVSLPCFAEIRVKRDGAREGGITVNTAIYWNDKYSSPNVASSKEMAKNFRKDFDKFKIDYASITFNSYYDCDGYYECGLKYLPNDELVYVQVDYVYYNGYNEHLYIQEFYSFNIAKAKFDSLCQQYYNKIPK